MEYIHQEANTHIAFANITSSSNQKAVYQATTVPIVTNGNGTTTGNGRAATSIDTDATHVQLASTSAESTELLAPPSQSSTLNGSGGAAFKYAHISSLPAREPLDIQFKDVSYTAKLGIFRGTKEILHKVNGKLPGRQLTAIMGPSGAGKSTLLDVLSGYRRTGVDGAVYVNGRVRNLDTFRKMSCYITQEDQIQVLLTVMENMQMAANFKLGDTLQRHEKESRIEEILTLLGLYEHQATRSSRLSGGQRKRLSIALELINNPTVMFLDEPTTGLDTHSCNQVVSLLRHLASQGRTIICTIHQPSAKLFQEFDQVYVLAAGECLYQGSTQQMVPFLKHIGLPCPKYHNPADYVIELACCEYGEDKMQLMVHSTGNGECLDWFDDPSKILKLEELRTQYPLSRDNRDSGQLEATSSLNQLTILLKRGYLKGKRDTTLTYLRIGVNLLVALMLGTLFINSGNEGSRVLDNYNLLFAILLHHSMTTMMLTVLTFPIEMGILLKEHFNRWYSLKMYYTSVTIMDIPMSIVCCLGFSVIIYILSAQPMEWSRFLMFFVISLLVSIVGQSVGLIIGAWFDVVNGTFLAPTLNIPMMMFAGFGVTLRDLPGYLKWGSHISYLRYGLEGYVGAIYGNNRSILACEEAHYCHYRYPTKFLNEISMQGDQFWTDVWALLASVLVLKVAAYYLLRWKVVAVR